MGLKRTGHSVYDTGHHLEWYPKYRRKILEWEEVRKREKHYDRGDLRGLRHHDSVDGDYGGSHPGTGVIPAVSVDKGGRANNQEPEWAGAVSRVPGTEEEAVWGGEL